MRYITVYGSFCIKGFSVFVFTIACIVNKTTSTQSTYAKQCGAFPPLSMYDLLFICHTVVNDDLQLPSIRRVRPQF